MSQNSPPSKETVQSLSRIIAWALIPMGLLLVPFIAMQVTEEVQWNVGDFAVAGGILAAAGSVYALLTPKRKTAMYRKILGLVTLVVIALIWAELAVGIFG